MPRSTEGVLPTTNAENPARWVNDKNTAAHMGISIMTLHRLRQDPSLGFPQAARVMGTKRTSLDEVDAWMRSHRQSSGQAA
jgi:hypothetical protein